MVVYKELVWDFFYMVIEQFTQNTFFKISLNISRFYFIRQTYPAHYFCNSSVYRVAFIKVFDSCFCFFFSSTKVSFICLTQPKKNDSKSSIVQKNCSWLLLKHFSASLFLGSISRDTSNGNNFGSWTSFNVEEYKVTQLWRTEYTVKWSMIKIIREICGLTKFQRSCEIAEQRSRKYYKN